MSNEPSLDLQEWLVAVLRNDSTVASLVGDRIYDQLPRNPVFPYVQVGDDETIAEGVGGLYAYTVASSLHAFSRSPGRVEIKRIAAAVRDAIRTARDADPNASPTAYRPLDGFTLQNIQERQVRFLLEPESLTPHAVITLESRIAKAR